MARMGHDSPQAAMISQHAASEADRAIAAAVDEAVRIVRPARPTGDDDDPDAKARGGLMAR